MKYRNLLKKVFLTIAIIMMIMFLKNVIGAHFEIYFYLFLLIIIGLYLIRKYKYIILKHKKILKKILIILIVLGVITRIALLFFEYQSVKQDFAIYYWNAVKLSYHSSVNTSYISMFPNVGYYVMMLGNIMKIFGTNYKVVIGTNIIFDFLSMVGIYFNFRNNSKRNAIIGVSLWSINPINIIWCTKCIPIVIFNTCLIYTLLLFSELKNRDDIRNIILPSIIFGSFIGVSYLFNPIIIILLISIILYLIISKNKKFVMLVISVLFIIAPYKIVTNSMEKFLEKSIKTEVNHHINGWNLYVGSDIKCDGSICKNLSLELEEKIEKDDFKPNEVNEFFKKKGIKNYFQNNKLKQNIKLFRLKYRKLTRSIGYGSVDNLNFTYKQTAKIPYYKYFIKLLKIICDTFIMISIISIILLSYYSIKGKIKCNGMISLVIGFLLYNLLFDANSIYMLPIIVPFTLIMVSSLNDIMNNIGNK